MICVVGSLNMDLVIDCQRIPSVGETVIGKQFHMIPEAKERIKRLLAED